MNKQINTIQHTFFEIYYLDLFVFNQQYIANYYYCNSISYTLRDWPIFFVNNSLKAITKVFAKENISWKIYFGNLQFIYVPTFLELCIYIYTTNILTLTYIYIYISLLERNLAKW